MPGGARRTDTQQRDYAAEKARTEVQAMDLALAVRGAARALLRGQEPAGLPVALHAWLRGAGEQAWAYLAVMKPDQIASVLAGNGTAFVPGYDARAWANAPLPSPLPPLAPEPPAPEAIRPDTEAAIREGLRHYARARVAERWELGDRSSALEPQRSGMRP